MAMQFVKSFYVLQAEGKNAEKQQAHHDISRKMKDVILKLKEIRASPHDIKTYFDRVLAQEKRQDKVKSYPIGSDM